MHIKHFSLAVLIYSKIGSNSPTRYVQPFSSAVLICLNNEGRATHILDSCSAALVSGFDLFKHWRATHLLDVCLATLVSISNLFKH